MRDRRKILVNINAKVRVKLSPIGLKTLEGKREEIQMHMRRNVTDLWPADPEGYHMFPLWEFMNLFGHLYIMGSAHMPTANNRIFFTEGGADNEVMIEPEFPGKTLEKSCETCGPIPAPPSYLRKSSMCDWHHDSIQRLGALFDELEKKHANSDQVIDKRLSDLEDQHRDIAAVPDEYKMVGFSSMYGKLYAKTEHKG
jgi:hypothetical protein